MPQPPPSQRALLRCDKCGRVEVPDTADIRGYIMAGWPRCCGQVMAVFYEADTPVNGTESNPPKK